MSIPCMKRWGLWAESWKIKQGSNGRVRNKIISETEFLQLKNISAMLMIGCEKLSRLMDKEKEKNGKKWTDQPRAVQQYQMV